MTANAQSQLTPEEIQNGLTRHAAGDWGDVCPDDAQSNEDALKHGDRLFSVYSTQRGNFWIITEHDRSVTTVLMPEDY